MTRWFSIWILKDPQKTWILHGTDRWQYLPQIFIKADLPWVTAVDGNMVSLTKAVSLLFTIRYTLMSRSSVNASFEYGARMDTGPFPANTNWGASPVHSPYADRMYPKTIRSHLFLMKIFALWIYNSHIGGCLVMGSSITGLQSKRRRIVLFLFLSESGLLLFLWHHW